MSSPHQLTRSQSAVGSAAAPARQRRPSRSRPSPVGSRAATQTLTSGRLNTTKPLDYSFKKKSVI